MPEVNRATLRKIKIAIVDDHPVVRMGLGALISRQPDLTICGEADDVSSGLELAETQKRNYQELTESAAHTNEKLNALIDVVDRIIRREQGKS